MFYSKETRINYLTYRINMLRSRNEMMNLRLIAALEREKRSLEESNV